MEAHEKYLVLNKVKAARQSNPRVPAASMAREFGVSSEYIRQCLIKLGLPTRVILQPKPGTQNGRAWIAKPFRYGVKISPLSIGTLCELQVCVDLMRRGFFVFRQVGLNGPCDLVAVIDGTMLKIEVRAAYNGNCSKNGTYDCLAAVESNGEILYKPLLETFTTKDLTSSE